MISRADVDKLLEVRAAGPSVLSLYLWVPLDPAELRGLPALAGELFALAARDGPGVPAGVRVGAADARAVRTLLASRARDWLGHTVAVFTCAELGLAEAIPLPCGLQERAVLAARPHVRPLLLAIQRCPAYRVGVVDHRHAWLFSIADGQIGTAVLPPTAAAARTPGHRRTRRLGPGPGRRGPAGLHGHHRGGRGSRGRRAMPEGGTARPARRHQGLTSPPRLYVDRGRARPPACRVRRAPHLIRYTVTVPSAPRW